MTNFQYPKRIQRRRSKGWRMPSGAVYVGRPTAYANPYTVAEYGRDEAVALFRQHLVEQPEAVAAGIAFLRGRDLACWCPLGVPCHADVWLEVVNA